MWVYEFKIPEDFLLLFKGNSLSPIQNIQIKFLEIKQFSVGYFNNTLDWIKKNNQSFCEVCDNTSFREHKQPFH